jgi:hypothetical protein
MSDYLKARKIRIESRERYLANSFKITAISRSL